VSLQLRSYQSEALDAVERSLLEHNRVLVVSPVGTGKTS
jgi:superfamily II DNA or RNA helicase